MTICTAGATAVVESIVANFDGRWDNGALGNVRDHVVGMAFDYAPPSFVPGFSACRRGPRVW